VEHAKASMAFLPWVRRGISTALGATANAGQRLAVPVEVAFGETRHANVTLNLFGPREVTGLDPRAIIRTWPAANVYDAEPNFFPLVEFDQSDLLWRNTPVATRENDRLQPWLCLIVLKDEEIREITPSGASRRLSVLELSDAAPLPLLEQAWAWALAQVAGVETIDSAQAAKLLDTEPPRLTSRLLCPRKLEPNTRYTAFLVPTYESGRRAGRRSGARPRLAARARRARREAVSRAGRGAAARPHRARPPR